uniref:Virulence associated protein E n=1 Tax=Rhodococcus hoagii TaxID=43767 RepID=W5QKW8_RHOHA|nr:virulence associated protein E [Prescottella equi]
MTTVHKKASKAIAFTVALRLPFAGTAVALVLIALTIVAAPTGTAGAREIGAQAWPASQLESGLAVSGNPVGVLDVRMAVHDDSTHTREFKEDDSEKQYPVHGFASSFIFYQTVSIIIDDDGRGGPGKTFEGEAGGITTPGAAGYAGVLFTSDLERLYRETVSFEYNAVGPYLNINLFAGDGGLLGHVQSGAISSLVGIGGGTGAWR